MIRITIGTKHPITIELDDWGDIDVGIADANAGSLPSLQYEPMEAEAKSEAEPEAEPEAEAEAEPEPLQSNGLTGNENEILHADLMNTGRNALQNLVESWAYGFGTPLDADGNTTIVQPDRAKLLQKTMAISGRSVMAYIEHCGKANPEQRGLRAAVRSVFPPTSATLPVGINYEQLTDEIAGNIVQLASIYVPPLADTIEYTYADSRG